MASSSATNLNSTSGQAGDNDLHKSIFTNSDQVYDIPMSAISRPIPSVLNEDKVQDFMKVIEAGTDMTPIEVMHLEKPSTKNPGETLSYLFAFGGCHRWEAHKRLGRPTVRARLIGVTEDTLRGHLGASLNIRE
ncbi:hypothetical protein RI367_006163 [Sorochytrium milnesiophthora]